MSQTVHDLMAEKIVKFKSVFATHISAAGITDEVNEITVDSLLANLIVFQPFWFMLSPGNEDALMALAYTPEDTKLEGVKRVLDTMPPETKSQLWRYVQFFLSCAKNTIGQ